MNRRFVNLVTANHESRMYSLRRFDVSKHLFYPSTADAEAAKADEINNGDAAGGGKDSTENPPKIERLRRLPAPSMHFHQFMDRHHRWPSMDDMFMLLGPRSSEGRILHTSLDGHALLYDADTRSTSVIPRLGDSNSKRPDIFISIAAAGPEEDSEGLYVLTSDYKSYSFEVLDLSRPHQWQPLPPPHFGNGDDRSPPWIRSYTVVDGGRTICISFYRIDDGGSATTTYCFDTASREWRKVGDWVLPFHKRAEYVPELDTWIGFKRMGHSSRELHEHLCVSDLSAMDAHQAPTIQHVWEELTPLKEEKSIVLHKRYPSILPPVVLERRRSWSPLRQDLVNLGSGRFCVARVLQVMQSESLEDEYDNMYDGKLVVFTGVEVVHADRNGQGGLRMVKHKSKCYKFAGDGLFSCSDEILWVL